MQQRACESFLLPQIEGLEQDLLGNLFQHKGTRTTTINLRAAARWFFLARQQRNRSTDRARHGLLSYWYPKGVEHADITGIRLQMNTPETMVP